jgi:large subunit ribosomal protein L10
VMLSKIAGLMKGEMSRAASMFQAAQSTFLSLLAAYKEKLPEDVSAEPAGDSEPEATAAGAGPDAPGPEEAAPAAQAQEGSTDETADAAASAEGED